MHRIAWFFLLSFSLAGISASAQTLFVGTYTRTPGRAGIFVLRFDTATKQAVLIDSARSSNPSFLAPSRDGKFLYSVSEQGQGKGMVQAWRVKGGKLTFVNEVSSGGDGPCYVAVDSKGRNVLVGNYGGGTLAILPVAPDGGVGAPEQIIEHQGSGPNLQRQERPHVHSTVLAPDENYVLAADLGTDKVVSYKYSARRHTLSDARYTNAFTAGSGPRHLDFHPKKDWVYVLQELSGTVTACRYKDGRMEPFQTISLMPEGNTTAAHSAD
ncbi:MAG: lactonase family protein, partial [Chitinophagaceae bacterium]